MVWKTFKLNGVKFNKLHDLEEVNILNRSDFIGLTETHDSNTGVSLQGYCFSER